MGFLDRVGNIAKGLLRKPLEALEKSPGERQLERELEEKAALERARANILDMERNAGGAAAKPSTARPATPPKPAEPAPKDDGNGKSKRRMGPD